MFIEIGIFLMALIVLIKSSDYFVKAAASIAEKLGINEFIIGLTLVAFGTSVPELASSAFAAARGNSGIVIGNIVGSNIANIGLVIGFAAFISTIKTKEEMLIRDGYIMLFSSILFYLLIIYGRITRFSAGILLVFYIVYIIFLFETKSKTRDEYHFNNFIKYFFQMRYIQTLKRRILEQLKQERAKNKEIKLILKEGVLKDIFLIIVTGIAIYFSAKYIVIEAVFFANALHLSETLIGVSLIAFGTSVPELSVSISAARKGYGDIAVGNIIGSNIANILLVGGIAGLIAPLGISKLSLLITGPMMLIMCLLLLNFIKSGWKIHRFEGGIFLGLYSLFLLILFFARNI